METRLADADDAAALTALHQASFPPAAGWSLAQITDSLKNQIVQTFVLPATGAPQGFLMLQLAGQEAEIITFCVSPRHRKAGMGQSLLDAALDEARAHKTNRVFLEVAADNEAALMLYRKNGFAINGKRAGYYRRASGNIDAMTLTLDLAAQGGRPRLKI
jgi:ribosomal-protein-alanine N-acetyltransferase